MATTFEALGRDEGALRATIERGPPTLDSGVRSFPVQRPFLADSETLFRHLRPAAVEMERSLPSVRDALHTGRPVLRRSPPFYARTRNVFRSLRELVAEPSTLMGLKNLTTTTKVVAPLIEYVAPYQTVCNYWLYYWTAISEHVSERVRGGTTQRVNLKSDNRTQDNRMSSSEADKPADVPKSTDPQGAEDPAGDPLTVLHRQAYEPAIDAQGNADCQVGQRGYLNGPLVEGNRYPPSDDPDKLGGSHVILDSNIPGLSGPTFKGVPNLRDVP
jgi:phospholipid/cholesterol/gamma-HCH transport system substrate-binding protein